MYSKADRILIVLMALTLGLAAVTLNAQSSQPASRPEKPAADGKKYTWLVLNFRNHAYTTTVSINGKEWNSFEKGGGFDSKPSPFREGENHIKVVFTPKAKSKAGLQRVSLQLVASTKMAPDNDAACIAECETEEGFEENNIAVTFKDGRPGRVKIEAKRWDDAERQHLTWQMSAEGEVFADEFERRKTMIWTSKGKLFSESVESGGNLVWSKDYKPDGTMGAEVKNGEGIRRKYYEDGVVESEIPVRKGQFEGGVKEFHANGKVAATTEFVAGEAQGKYREFDLQGVVRVTGTFKADKKDGTWVRYDERGKEVARSVFAEDELVQGQDRF